MKTTTKTVLGLFTLIFGLSMAFHPTATFAKDNDKDDHDNNGKKACTNAKVWWSFGSWKHMDNKNEETIETCTKQPHHIPFLWFWNNNSGTSDTTAPYITNIWITDRTNTSVSVNVFTNERAMVQINYGTSDSYGSSTSLTASSAFYTTIPLSGLTADTTYHFRVTVKDATGNSRTSGDYTFETRNNNSDNIDPRLSDIKVSELTASSAVISWNTDKTATTHIEYGTTSAYGTVIHDNALTMTHTKTLNGLAANTIYHFRVSSTDSNGNVTTSNDRTFTTKTSRDPVVSNIVLNTTSSTSVIISWQTNRPTASSLFWATTTPVDTATANKATDTTLRSNHAFVISGLSANTTYHYMIEATDSENSKTTTTEASFTTT
jgi:hypothetical protein